MTSSVDTNVLVALWSGETDPARQARRALEEASARGPLVICAAVYAELCAAPGRDVAAVDDYLRRRGMRIDWNLDEAVWRSAGVAYRSYAERRRGARGDPGPRRILTDFIIGAHAGLTADALLTSDQRIYRSAYPSLTLIDPLDYSQ